MTNATLTLDRSGRYAGMHNGTLIVATGTDIDIAGMVNGTMIVEPGATVLVSGMFNGTVDNRGGTVRTTGMINP